MADRPVHLLDVDVVIALLDEEHTHHEAVSDWFDTPGLRWALCAFAEAGVLRFFTRPKTGTLSVKEVTGMLAKLKERPGYHYQSIAQDWHTLAKPFFHRLHGHQQVTDAYLLGIAIREKLILATLDRALLHLAGEHRQHVHMLAC